MPLDVLAAFLVSVAAFLALRLWPIWPNRHQGCDAFNILLCAEAVRRTRRLPPSTPGLFILEEADQWYPPLFFLLCALVPQGWLKRRYWLLNQLVDLANAALLFAIVVLGGGGPLVAGAAVVAYAIVAGLVQEFAALNTRPLGLLVLNLFLLSGHLASQNPAYLPLALAAGLLLVYGHKLSAQQAWFTLPILALVTGDWLWAALLPGIYLAAFLVWPRGFRRIVAGHAVIVRFWHRHWPLLGAHMVRQSPVYGDGTTVRQFYAADRGATAVGFCKEGLHQNYFLLPALVALVGAPSDPLALTLAGWIGSVYLAAGLIHFVPALRGIGMGRQYIKFALLPSLIASAIGLSTAFGWPIALATGVAAALSVRQYRLVARAMRASGSSGSTGAQNADLARLLDHLRDDADARILALPVHLCDLVAYETRRPVYWGTHAQVFDHRLEAFFPVLRHRLVHYARDGRLNRLLVDIRYATAEELALEAEDLIEQSGTYRLYRLREGEAGQ